jgi:hypothetical protein
MENSNSFDYVTEKSWDVFKAGCVPLYLGAPNALQDFFPSNDSAILVERFESLDDLAAEVKLVLNDKAASFERYTAWRRRPFDQLNPGYRSLLGVHQLPETRCQVCQLLADRRLLRQSRQQASGAAESGSSSGAAPAERIAST